MGLRGSPQLEINCTKKSKSFQGELTRSVTVMHGMFVNAVIAVDIELLWSYFICIVSVCVCILLIVCFIGSF